MSLLKVLNATQAVAVADVAFRFNVKHVAPLLLLESFAFGVACTVLLLWIYWALFVKTKHAPTKIKMLALPAMYLILAIHWSMLLHNFCSIFNGTAMNLPFSDLYIEAYNSALNDGGSWVAIDSLNKQGTVLLYLLPFVAETAFFGSLTALFTVLCYVASKQRRDQPDAALNKFIVRAVICVMFLFSLVHWCIDLLAYIVATGTVYKEFPFNTILVNQSYIRNALIYVTILLSDGVVLWRMCVLWEMRPILLWISGAALAATTGFSIANTVALAQDHWVNRISSVEVSLPTFNASVFGLLAMVVSLMSNGFSTIAIAYKAWQHRKLLKAQLQSNSCRTLVEKIMSILMESGAVYCCIWILWIIASYFPVGAAGTQIKLPGSRVLIEQPVLEDYLNVIMAQLTSIYPLLVLLLVAFERTHCDRGFSLNEYVTDELRFSPPVILDLVHGGDHEEIFQAACPDSASNLGPNTDAKASDSV